MTKVLVAMSGGVDSSVAAALLARQGFEVTGVHLKLAPGSPSAPAEGRAHGCCSVADADDARRVAQVLDIPFYVWNLTESFNAAVVDDFVDEYASGRTPNPCVRCNERIKFGHVLERGMALGFDKVATGHYAIVRHDGRPRLYRSADMEKDQSYVLSTIGAGALSRALFPVGAMTKAETRRVASDLSLRTADKPESYDICFVEPGRNAEFVERFAGPFAEGPILDQAGVQIGVHRGVHRFTVGQRRGLGLGIAQRRFVLDVDAPGNTVTVGPGELLLRTGLQARRPAWFGDAPSVGDRVAVRIRAHGAIVPASVESCTGDAIAFKLERPERGVAAGQSVAVYDGDEVLGGATIAGATK